MLKRISGAEEEFFLEGYDFTWSLEDLDYHLCVGFAGVGLKGEFWAFLILFERHLSVVLHEPDFPSNGESIEDQHIKQRNDNKGCQEEPDIRRIKVSR